MAKGERIGVLGGTFDPIHVGHLVAATRALHECHLDRVLLMVANAPWQKVSVRSITDAEVRFAMVELAVSEHPGLRACRAEIDRGGLTYTADTLELLSEDLPRSELFLICGSDTVAGIESWKRSTDIARLATIAVLGRSGEGAPSLGAEWRVERVTMPSLDISSTDLRRRIGNGEPVDFLIPQPVLHEIAIKGLYDGRKASAQ